ncbi:MAG: hypothetical protein ACI4UX_05685 [Clostridia bacterium]
MKKIKNIFVVFTIISIITMTGCSKNDDKENLKDKVNEELNYLDTHIISIANNLNNISLENYKITSESVEVEEKSKKMSTGNTGGSQETATGQTGEESSGQSQSSQNSENNNINTTKMEENAILDSNQDDIDWKAIKYEIENINQTWSVILLDLYSLNVSNDDIVAFSEMLNNSIISIKNENKIDSLSNIAKMYSYIPIYEKAISAENSMQNIKQTKSFLINAYSFVEQGNWNEIQTNINECEKTFKNIVNDMEFAQKNEYKINKTYVLIKEMQNSLYLQDKEIFYIKYKNLLESINTL